MASAVHHRRDVQGLRAVAVLLVVIFHAGLPLSGGFIGVDVFFVISGFVITRMLMSEIERDGRIDFARFYARRLHRLAPPLALLIVVTLPIFVIVTDPMDAQRLGSRTAAAATVFLANVYLLVSKGGYFGANAESNPFLHTWSLSVEEQFYLITPLLIMVGWRIWRRWSRVALLIGGCSAASFLIAVVAMAAIDHDVPSWMPGPGRFAFFFVAPRFWELGAGVVFALVGGEGLLSRRHRVVVGVTALLLLAVGAFTFDRYTLFPGISALVPVVATLMFLFARVKFLEAAPLVWLGDRSYSWYLWHWPAIVIAHAVWPTSSVALPLAATVALLPAIVSFHVVENPLRRSTRRDARRLVALTLTCVVLPLGVALAVSRGAQSGWGLQHPEQWTALSISRRNGCIDVVDLVFPATTCTHSVENARGVIALVGDSHAASASDAVVLVASELGYDVAMWSASSYPFLDGVTRRGTSFQQQVAWRTWIDDLRPVAVIAVAQTSNYVRAEALVAADGNIAATRAEAVEMWSSGFDRLAATFEHRQLPLIWFHPGPSLPLDPKVTLLRPSPDETPIGVEASKQARLDIVVAEHAVAARHPNVVLFDPVQSLCSETCPVVHDGAWLYSDSHHLTPAGSMLLRDQLRTALKTALAH